MYADIPWVLATGGQKGELAIWDTEEDMKIVKHFKEQMPKKARLLKKAADKGLEAGDANMVEEGDSSGFEDVNSDEEEDDTQEELKNKAKKADTKAGKKQTK